MRFIEFERAYLRHWREFDLRTLFKIIVFAYINRIYSAREIVKICKTDILFMWTLRGDNPSSHATISRFMDEYLLQAAEETLYQLIMKLHKK